LAALLLFGQPSRAQAQFGARQDIVSVYLFNGQDEATFRKQLETRSMLRVAQVAEVAQLDEATLEKLNLAVRGDLNRFYRCIAAVREATKDYDMQNQEEMQKAWQEIMPLQQRIAAGVLEEEGSLFSKVLECSLTEEQTTAYEAYLAERQRAKSLAIVKMTLAEMQSSIPLLAKQRNALVDTLMNKKFPRRVPEGYEAFLGYIMMTKLDDKELESILDRQQVLAFKKLIAQYEAYGNAVTW
jgi:hypothetical protein